MTVRVPTEDACQQPDADDPSIVCGAAAAADQRCLAHLTPDARAAWLAALGPGADIDARGVVFSEELLDELSNALGAAPEFGSVDFGGATFNGAVSFKGATFSRTAMFEETTFNGNALFEDATFDVNALFEDATFGSNADFHGVTVSHDAGFWNTRFGGDADFEDATFNGNASFQAATVTGYANFEWTTFVSEAWFQDGDFGSKATFERATFSGVAKFGSASFHGGARFEDAAFNAPALFGNVTFGADTDFEYTTFNGAALFRNVTFSGEAEFMGAAFNTEVRFDSAVFNANAAFGGVTFRGAAWFKDAKFNENASFRGSTFHASARFAGTTFHANAEFWSATFYTHADFGRTTFNGDASFDVVTISGDAWFEHAAFAGESWFERAAFGGEAGFEGATFDADAGFKRATFSQHAGFDRVTFRGHVGFEDVTFMKAVSFESALLRSEMQIRAAANQVDLYGLRGEGRVSLRLRAAKVDLTDVVLTGPVSVLGLGHPIDGVDETAFGHGAAVVPPVRVSSVRGLDAALVTLTDVDLTKCRFVGLRRADQIVLDGQCVFADGPGGRRRVLAEEHHWRAEGGGARAPHSGIWLRLPEDDAGRVELVGPARLEVLYRQLRKALEDAKNEPGAADFYYGEMEMRRAATSRRTERWLLALYWAASGYGLRARRALAWLALLIVLSIGGLAWFGFPQTAKEQKASGMVVTQAGRQPITLSIRQADPVRPLPDRVEKATEITLNAVIFRSPDADLTTAGRYFNIATRILGPVLLGLSVLAIRNQVKR